MISPRVWYQDFTHEEHFDPTALLVLHLHSSFTRIQFISFSLLIISSLQKVAVFSQQRTTPSIPISLWNYIHLLSHTLKNQVVFLVIIKAPSGSQT